jgi:ATP-dependent Clp protease ATP-binding subunit ClpC
VPGEETERERQPRSHETAAGSTEEDSASGEAPETIPDGAFGLAAAGGDPGAEGADVTVLGHLGVDLLELAGSRPSLANGDLWIPELTRLKEILERKERHAALLVGPDGVGKRELVISLARDIADGRAPRHLLGRRIIELPFHRVLASSRQQGDFERIVFTGLREAGSRDDVIVFLSEIPSFLGVFGGRAAPIDAAYAIQTACHQPNIYMIGTATPQLYREAVRALPGCLDAMALVEVEEPDREACVSLLSQTVEALEEYHGVKIEDDAVRESVNLSADYMRDSVLPGKAYRLLDDAAARAATSSPGRDGTSVGPDDVRSALSDIVGIPAEKLAESGQSGLLGLEEALGKRVKGQDRCIRTLADVIRVTRLNLDASPSRPNGVFLFVGPPGVGKSELARALAEELYGRSERLFEFNMARYSDEDGVPRLVGMSTADVEYAGDLTTAVGRTPHSVVLLEHIERSHRDVAVMLVQIFRDGFVVDGHGAKVSFSNATFIMTTSAESLVPTLEDNGAVGFSHSERDQSEHHLREAKEAIEVFFPPDFMDGIDEVLLFDPLSEEALREIVEMLLEDVRRRLSERSITLRVTDDAMATIAEKGASREYGARNLGRTVERMLLKPVAKHLLAHPDAREVTVREIEGDLEVSE